MTEREFWIGLNLRQDWVFNGDYITHANLVRSSTSRKDQGYCFIHCKTPDAAAMVKQAIDNTRWKTSWDTKHMGGIEAMWRPINPPAQNMKPHDAFGTKPLGMLLNLSSYIIHTDDDSFDWVNVRKQHCTFCGDRHHRSNCQLLAHWLERTDNQGIPCGLCGEWSSHDESTCWKNKLAPIREMVDMYRCHRMVLPGDILDADQENPSRGVGP